MNCRRVLNLVSAYVDGELTGVEMLEIRRHLAGCAECAREHQSILFTKQSVARLEVVAPRREFVAALMASLDEVQVSPLQRAVNSASRYLHRRLSPVAAALTASGLAMVVLSAGGVMDTLSTQPTDYAAVQMPFQPQTVSASFLPDVHSSPTSIVSGRPLPVADSNTAYSGTGVQFVSFAGGR